MYTKRNYGFLMTLNWSKKALIAGVIYGLILTILWSYTGLYLSLPWQPLSVIGIAVAFYLGFKNNSSYDRTWEARKIWGSIVNNSRSFAATLIAFLPEDQHKTTVKELIYRHLSWLVALTWQLRLSREWEHTEDRLNLYESDVCDAYNKSLSDALKPYLSDSEMSGYVQYSNTATQILKKQAQRLQELCDENQYSDFKHVALNNFIVSFYEDQGKSERIKNFPFPRQYASTALWLTWVFCAFVPLGILDVFRTSDFYSIWLTAPVSGLIIWIFFLMEQIGDYSENPFEGSYNDVPISTIARSIEIDLREMLQDVDIPGPLPAINGFQL